MLLKQRIMSDPEKFDSFYTKNKLGFDLTLVKNGFKTFKPHFRGKSVLELGPASGYMTSLIVNEFDEVTVVEGSKKLIDQIPNYDNLTKIHSLFEDFDPDKCFDTVIMNHVLEHIEKPLELLKKIYNWLKKDGILIIGVPNAKSFHRLAAVHMGLLKNEYELNSRDKELGHYRVYDMDMLKQSCINSGFVIKDEGGIFLKFLSNNQIENYLNINIINAYFELASSFHLNSAEIFLILKK
jgi:2-polyprenyl-3-methyl-5-hydroxy-6-metoxy-1,4-benzoquinol methylase